MLSFESVSIMEWGWTLLLWLSLNLITYESNNKNNKDVFLCSDGETQLEGGEVCDGIRNCPFSETNPSGGEDEQDCNFEGSNQIELPSPKIVIVGATGTGKSSMANSLLGLDPENMNALFEVCDSYDSCTKETTYGVGQWLGEGSNFTVVDTPGFGDSDNEDPQLIEEMLDVLKNTVKDADAIVLLINGGNTRFTSGLQSMLSKMSTIFGEGWWDFMIIGVSFWEYDRKSIDGREEKCNCKDDKLYRAKRCRCKDEKWLESEVKQKLKDIFHVEHNFSFAFVYSYSQTAKNRKDDLQQQYWKQETEKLWKFVASRNSTFEFKGIDDILEDNRRMKREVASLNNIIEANITALAGRMDFIQEDMFMQITELKKELKEEVSHLGVAPLGTILSWTPFPDRNTLHFAYVPDNWMLCDGSEIREGIWKGQKTPDLNHAKRFLRGGVVTEALYMEDDEVKTLKYVDRFWHLASDCPDGSSHLSETMPLGVCNKCFEDSYCQRTLHINGGSETKPKNMNVVFIIKIK